MTRLGGAPAPKSRGHVPATLFGGPYDGKLRSVKLNADDGKPPRTLTFVATELVGRRPVFAFYRYELDRSRLGVCGYTYADPNPATDEETPDA